MDHAGIFSATLGLSQQWQIDRISFDNGIQQVDLFLSCIRTARFTCPVCGARAQFRDTREELWHHVDFFQYSAYIHANVPLVECRAGCGVKAVAVPWSRPGSRFILLARRTPTPAPT